MNTIREKFLLILRAALDGSIPAELENTTPEEWNEIFRLAGEHHVMPLVYEAGYRLSSVRDGKVPAFLAARQLIFRQVMAQVQKTSEFLQLYRHLQSDGITPLVTKGIICRNLYPQPDHRPSGDEDVLIPPDQFESCHESLLRFGMETVTPEEAFHSAHEISYHKPGSPLYIELHKHLFPPESDAYGRWNLYFEDVFERSVDEDIYGNPVGTMGCTDHFFYLICHSFKHFLHCGFGIRQVCDIVLYANKYGSRIDWELLLRLCREIRAEYFTAALLKIGEKYLTFDPAQACYPPCWQELQIDEEPMLEDLLSGGVFGGSTMSRKHSSTITLDAAAASSQGQKAKSSLIASLFPPLKSMVRFYPYLEKHPWLLPWAWFRRIVRYSKETRTVSDSSAAEALKIGKERITLMKTYGIIN